jgi:hypothetical protein
VTVENFDGNGFADQPPIIYAVESDDDGDIQIRKIVRSGFCEPGPSPGDVIEPETIISDPADSVLEL